MVENVFPFPASKGSKQPGTYGEPADIKPFPHSDNPLALRAHEASKRLNAILTDVQRLSAFAKKPEIATKPQEVLAGLTAILSQLVEDPQNHALTVRAHEELRRAEELVSSAEEFAREAKFKRRGLSTPANDN